MRTKRSDRPQRIIFTHPLPPAPSPLRSEGESSAFSSPSLRSGEGSREGIEPLVTDKALYPLRLIVKVTLTSCSQGLPSRESSPLVVIVCPSALNVPDMRCEKSAESRHDFQMPSAKLIR